MRQTVQEDMFANISVSKLKRAKAMVMEKTLDASKGQYQRLYDYQLELLRSNPGSTVIVHKVPDTKPPTFPRIYIFLDALKKGFLAGCRRVVGPEGAAAVLGGAIDLCPRCWVAIVEEGKGRSVLPHAFGLCAA